MLRQAIVICAATCGLASCVEPVPPMRTFFDTLDDGADIEVTMKFIQNALNSIGSFEYSEHEGWFLGDKEADPSEHKGEQYVENVVADPLTCQVQYRTQRTFDGKTEVAGEQLRQIDLKQALKVVAYSQKEQLEGINQVAGPGQLRVDFSPPIFVLKVRFESPPYHSFLLFDKELADEIARAMNHAISLCRRL